MSPEFLLVRLDSAGFTVMYVLFTLLWQSTVLFAACGALAFLLRRRRESVRHALWVSAILLLPFLPILSWTVSKIGAPRREFPVLPAYTATVANTPGAPDVSTFRRAAIPETPSALPPQKGHRIPLWDYPWALALFAYLAAATVLLLAVPIGWLRVRRWIARGDAVLDDRVLAIFEEVRARIGMRREVALVESETAAVPLAFGMFRPLVLLPRGFAARLSDTELEAVAAHELSHIHRRDPLTLTLVALVRAAFFFQPLAWLAAREAGYLAECACDASVLDLTGEARPYAGFLSRLAEDLPQRPVSAGYAPGFLFSRGVFLRRVEAILSEKRKGMKRLTGLALAGILVAATVTLAFVLAFGPGEIKVANAASKQPPGTIIVSGKVLHNNLPVAGARVYLHTVRWTMWEDAESTGLVARSGGDGSFRFPVEKYKLDGENWYLSLIAYSTKYAIASESIEKKTDIGNIVIALVDAASLSGVVREKSGRPIPGAEVKIRAIYSPIPPYSPGFKGVNSSIPEMTVKTDRKGRFSFTTLPAGLSVGYEINAPGYGFEYHVPVDVGKSDVTVILAHEGRIEGRLVYSDTGKPAAGYTVSTMGTDTWSAGGKPATTDRDGRFFITNARPDSYTVLFYKKSPTESKFPGYAQAVFDTVSVSEGKTVRMGEVKLVRGGVITGRVTKDDTGEPVQGVWVAAAATARVNTSLGRGITDREGRFRFRVMPGKAEVYIFTNVPEGYIGRDVKEVEVVEGETVEGVDLRCRKGITVNGRVLSPDGAPVAGKVAQTKKPTAAEPKAPVVIAPATPVASAVTDTSAVKAVAVSGKVVGYDGKSVGDASLSIILKNRSGRPVKDVTVKVRAIRWNSLPVWDMREKPPTISKIIWKSDQNGRVVITGLHDDVVLGLDIVGPGCAREYHQAVQAGAKDVPFVLRPEGRIEGRVTFADTGKPAGGILVQGTGDDVFTDSDGRYALRNVPPGTYLVDFAQTAAEGALREYAVSVKDNVVVAEGQTIRNVDAQLVRGGIITGRVTKEDTGEPVPEDWVVAYGRGTGVTDANGVYRIRIMPGKTYVYSMGGARVEGYINDDTHVPVEVAEGQTVNGVDFKYRKGVTITGKVLLPDGKPAAGAVIFWGGKIPTGKDGEFTLTGLREGDSVNLTAMMKERGLQGTTEFIVQPGMDVILLR